MTSLKTHFEATMNGLLSVTYLWLGIAILAAPHMVAAIQTLDDVRKSVVTVCSILFGVISSIGLATRIGLLKTTDFTRDETILPLVSVFALSLYLL